MGRALRLELTPQPGSDLQRYLAMLSPNAAGVPALPGDSRLDLRLSLNPDLLHNLTQPFAAIAAQYGACLLYTSPSPRARTRPRMPTSA